MTSVPLGFAWFMSAWLDGGLQEMVTRLLATSICWRIHMWMCGWVWVCARVG